MKALLVNATPKARLALASGLVLVLAALAPVSGAPAASAARWVLGAALLIGLGGWMQRRGQVGSGALAPEPLRVVSRTGLSPRCGLALVEVEGSRYLVAFGDSFATIRQARAADMEEETP